MTPRKVKAPPYTVVLTGASGGLGRALTEALAHPGARMLLCGRDAARLRSAAEVARGQGAQADCLSGDLRAPETLAAIRSFAERQGVDLLLVNAGVKAGNTDGLEGTGQARRVVDVGLASAIATVEAVLPGMHRRGHGQIALISSLSAEAPAADLLSYSACKAGLRAYGIALRRALAGTGLGVSIVIPGYIDTPMTDRHLGPTPLKISADEAARRILRGLREGKAEIAFPRRLVWLARTVEILPVPLADWLVNRQRARILPDADETEAETRGGEKG